VDRLTTPSMETPVNLILTVVFHMMETLQEAFQHDIRILGMRQFRMHYDQQLCLGMTTLVMKVLFISLLF